MKKLISLILLAALLASCAAAEGVRVAALKGPTAMGMVKLMADSEAGSGYDFQICAAADEITPQLAQGKLDIAALPANLAAILYSRMNGGLQVLAVNTLGVLYIAERGERIQSVADLRGKTIYSAGKGSTPEYALSYILRGNGLTPGEDVFIEFKSEHAECLSALMKDGEAVAMLPQPFMTTALSKAGDMRVALDLTAEWDALQPEEGDRSAMITGVLVARRDFIEENPAAVAEFMDGYAASVAFAQENVVEAALLVDSYGIVSAEVAQKALPACKIVCITGDEMQEDLSGYLEVLYAQNPDSVGGSLPDAQFYYTAYGADE